MKTNTWFVTAATASLLGLGLAPSSYAQNSSSSSRDQKSASDQQNTTSAVDPKTGTAHPDKLSDQELKKKVTNINKASKLMGMSVKNLQDESLGKVDDLAIDPDSGKIAYAVLSVGGFLGINEKYIAVPLNSLTPAPGADHLILDADKQRLDRAPGFAKNKWPDLDTPAWSASAGFPSRTALNSSSSSSASGGTGHSAQQQGSEHAQSSSGGLTGKALQEQSPSNSGDNSSPKHYSGTINAVDGANRTVTVSGNDGDKQFNLDKEAQISVGTQNDAKLTDLKKGAKVSVEYQDKDGKAVAKSVQSQEKSEDSSSSSSSDDKQSSSDKK